MCGSPIEISRSRKVFVDGAELILCPTCSAKLSPKSIKQEVLQHGQQKQLSLPVQSIKMQHRSPAVRFSSSQSRSTSLSLQSTKSSKMLVSEKLELVDDFAERIRRAREALGWDQKTLALKLKVSENIVKRLESGKLRPPIDLAKKIEEILNIKILVPAVDEMVSSRGKVEKYVTFGEIVSIRGAEEE